MLNLGVFGAVALLAGADAGLALGMGLFGILSIIRLRSTAISQTEVAYYFVALVLGLVNSLGATWLPFMLAINVLLLGSLVALDRGAAAIASRPTEKRRIVLDVVHDDHTALCADVTTRLRTPVLAAIVEEVDYVRDVMVVVVEVETPRVPEPAPSGHEPLEDRPAGANAVAHAEARR